MKNEKLRALKGNALLVLTALIWGLAFVAQDQAALYVPCFTLNGLRSIIGGLLLLPLIALRSHQKGSAFIEKDPLQRKDLWMGGILCGIFLCIGSNFQQFGIGVYPAEAAASGRSGFITALYVVLVPLVGLLGGKKVVPHILFGVLLAAVGMAFLCLSGGIDRLYAGDLWVLCCAFGYTFQVLMVDRYANRVDGIKLSCIQFFVCGALSLILMLLFEKPDWSQVGKAWNYVLYIGVFSTGIAYTLQTIGQGMSRNPTVASLCMSLESVFAALGGAILLGERFTGREVVGAVLIFSAIVLSQLPEKLFQRKK